jgi:hypothetical protein
MQLRPGILTRINGGYAHQPQNEQMSRLQWYVKHSAIASVVFEQSNRLLSCRPNPLSGVCVQQSQ